MWKKNNRMTAYVWAISGYVLCYEVFTIYTSSNCQVKNPKGDHIRHNCDSILPSTFALNSLIGMSRPVE